METALTQREPPESCQEAMVVPPWSIAVPQGGGFTGGSEKPPEAGYVLMVESTGLPDE